MNYTEIINNPNYEKIAELHHNEIKSFVIRELLENKGWARVAIVYQLLGLFVFMFGFGTAFGQILASREYVFLVYLVVGAVFLFSFGILFHELLHALAYKYVGAKKVSFGMKLKKFLFYVQADGEVFNYKQFKIVALTPMLVVGVNAIAGMAIFYNQPLFYFFLSIFALHSFCCAGDLGILCFFQNRPNEEIVTFDRKSEGKSYFYARKGEKHESTKGANKHHAELVSASPN